MKKDYIIIVTEKNRPNPEDIPEFYESLSKCIAKRLTNQKDLT